MRSNHNLRWFIFPIPNKKDPPIRPNAAILSDRAGPLRGCRHRQYVANWINKLNEVRARHS